jgi:signal transduction histidine kinase
VKYTPSGEIAIAIRPKANCCEIAIRDQGPVLPSIMSTRSLSVTGAAQSAPRRPPAPVWLYVARQIIQAHGGELWLANGPTGCEFALTLPQDDLPQQKGKS